MATVNFSVPDDLKEAFNTTFANQNKSAIIAELMLEAIERAARKQRSHEAIGRIAERRKHAPAITDDALSAAREQGRP